MVAMGRAPMLDPRLLLLDEPSAGRSPVPIDTVFAATSSPTVRCGWRGRARPCSRTPRSADSTWGG